MKLGMTMIMMMIMMMLMLMTMMKMMMMKMMKTTRITMTAKTADIRPYIHELGKWDAIEENFAFMRIIETLTQLNQRRFSTSTAHMRIKAIQLQ